MKPYQDTSLVLPERIEVYCAEQGFNEFEEDALIAAASSGGADSEQQEILTEIFPELDLRF